MIEKEHKEFHAVDLGAGWHVPPGYPPGIEQKNLSGQLDEANHKGSRTRLLRFLPGVFTTKPFVHEYWEEVYLLSGDLYVLARPEQRAIAPCYSCRPPGTLHGPFGSRAGCVLLEVQYYPQYQR